MALRREVLNEASWFPISLTNDYRSIVFAKTNDLVLGSEPFLDRRFYQSVPERCSVPVDDIPPTPLQKEPSWIFHSAFCCSTLLAAALHETQGCLALKEPDVLMDLANAKRMLPKTDDGRSHYNLLKDIVFTLLSRQHDDRPIVIKPTNTANNLLEDVLALGHQVTIITSSLPDFLVSVAKKGEACRHFIRTVYNIFSLDPSGLQNFPSRQAMTFTDFQVSTLIWRAQMELFSDMAARYPDQIVTLTDREFLENKEQTLTELCGHFDLSVDEDTIRNLVDGRFFEVNAKFDDQRFSDQIRDEQSNLVKAMFDDDIALIDQWASKVRLQREITLPLPNNLHTA